MHVLFVFWKKKKKVDSPERSVPVYTYDNADMVVDKTLSNALNPAASVNLMVVMAGELPIAQTDRIWELSEREWTKARERATIEAKDILLTEEGVVGAFFFFLRLSLGDNSKKLFSCLFFFFFFHNLESFLLFLFFFIICCIEKTFQKLRTFHV